MQDLLGRFTSRTLWFSVGAFITLIVEERYTEAVAIAIAYVTGEKVRDTIQGPQGPSSVLPDGSESVDRSKIQTGLGTIRDADAE